MCTHVYNDNGEFCDFQNDFDGTLPVDPSGERCIFHSKDLVWKRKMNCLVWFKRLIEIKNSKGDIELSDLEIVGGNIPQEMKADFEGEDCAIILDSAIVSNDLVLFNCTFHDDVYVHRVIFKEVVALNGCKFEKGLIVNGSTFKEDTNVESGCIFKKEFIICNSSMFVEHVSVYGNTFKGEVFVEESCFQMPFHVIDNVFTATDLHVTFSSEFLNGISFDKNSYSGLLSFVESSLHNTCTINSNNGTPWVNLNRVELHGVFRFEGSVHNLLFQTKAEIRLDEITFHKSAMLVFDHCNMLNLSQDFLTRLKELEKEEKVSILESCKMYRFQRMFRYEGVEENDDVFIDFHRLVTRYFLSEFALTLDVSFIRFKESKILQVYYSSIHDIIDEFDGMQYQVLQSIDTKAAPTPELELQRRSTLLRLSHKLNTGELDKKLELELRSDNERVPVYLNVENLIVESEGMLQIGEASISTLNSNKTVITNLNELKNPLQFNLNEEQFDQIKAQIASISDLTSISNGVNAILKTQKEAKEKENSLTEFLLQHGIRVGGAMTGATLFTFLRMVFPF